MVETIDIPKGILVFLEGPCTPKGGKSMKSDVLWEKCKISNISCIFIKILEMCDFRMPACDPPNINIPLGISMVSSMSWSHRIMEIAKIMKFHENHGFSWILLKFHEIPWNSHVLCYMGASTPPWLKTLIFLRDYWWFRRPHRLESTESHVISAISWFSWFFAEFSVFTIKTLVLREFCIFLLHGLPKTPIFPKEYQWFHPWGRRGLHFTKKAWKSRKLAEIMVFMKFHRFPIFLVKRRPLRLQGWNHW